MYEFRFSTDVLNPDTFLYNTGPIEARDSENFNRRPTYSVTEVRGGVRRKLGTGLASPPCNIGPRSTPVPRSPGQRLRREADVGLSRCSTTARNTITGTVTGTDTRRSSRSSTFMAGRRCSTSAVTGAVFAELLAGTYWVLAEDGSAVRRVDTSAES